MPVVGKTIRIFLSDGEPTGIYLLVGPDPDDPSRGLTEPFITPLLPPK